MSRQIFRQVALNRLSSPEQLDHLVAVTDTRGWISLTTVLVLLLAIITWGVLGQIPDQVEGRGMLIDSGGRVVDLTAPAAGVVETVHVQLQQSVEAGQKLVAIRQSALTESLRSAEQTRHEFEAELLVLSRNQQEEIVVHERNLQQQVEHQQQVIEASQSRARYLEETLTERERLATSGVISRERLEQLRTDYARVNQDVSAAQLRILELEAAQLDLRTRQERDLAQAQRQVANANRSVRELRSQLERNAEITAPVSGRVTELKIFSGDSVANGQSLLTIATDSDTVEAILYVPTVDGKKVTPGMAVRVEPSTVPKEEFGTIVGEVVAVSEFPATREGMLSVLQNESLVREYAALGAPYVARVTLLTDAGTLSGFSWTSALGPPVPVTAGTTVEAEITVRKRPPVNLIVPFIREHTGVGF